MKQIPNKKEFLEQTAKDYNCYIGLVELMWNTSDSYEEFYRGLEGELDVEQRAAIANRIEIDNDR